MTTDSMPSNRSPTIIDVRRSEVDDMVCQQVIDGLSSEPRTLPALLFYSTKGIQHWNHHSRQPDFYPRHEEVLILQEKALEIASSIADGSIVLDLGSASIDKVLHLLRALEAQEKNITYYALDLSAEELASTLQTLPTHEFRHVRFAALHGTFDDGLDWLQRTPAMADRPRCMLLLGLTIGNYSRTNAAAFLSNIARHALVAALTSASAQSSIILTIDSCKVPTKVLRAYTSDGVVPFALESLEYGNQLLKRRVFDVDQWHFLSEWNHVLGRHEASLIPSKGDIELGTLFQGVTVRREDKVRFGSSYKYDECERQELFERAGLTDTASWGLEGCDVAFYQLKLAAV